MSYNPANFPIREDNILRGSLLITFNNIFDNPSSYFDVVVNSSIRDQQYYDTVGFFSTYLYTGDTVTVTLYGGEASQTLGLRRVDYTTEALDGNDGIYDTYISGVSGSNVITFSTTTTTNSYNFEYLLEIDTVILPTPTPTPTNTVTPTVTPSMTSTPSVTPSMTSTPVLSPTPTNTPTPTSTITPTVTHTTTITPSPTNTITPTNTVTPTQSMTPTSTVTPTMTATPTSSVTPTNTPTPTLSVTPTVTPTTTITPSPTNTVTPTTSVTPTSTVTPTMTATPTNTPTPTLSVTPTNTITPTSTITPTVTPTKTITPTPTNTITPTPSVTPLDCTIVGSAVEQTPIIQDGLSIYTTALNPASYPGTGSIWYSIATGTTYNGTLINGPTYNAGPPAYINFDGVNDYADYSSSSAGTDAQSWSFGGWTNMTQSSGERVVYQRGQDLYGAGFSLATYKSGDNKINQYVVVGGTGYNTASTTTIQSNTWYYVYGVFTYGATETIKIYVNGVLENTTNLPANTALRNSTYGWTLALANGFVSHLVKVSTFELYNKALTTGEILFNFNTTKTNYGY